METQEIVDALRKCELFNTIDEDDVTQIAFLCQAESYDSGDTIITQGEFGRRIYLIAEGQVALLRSVSLGERSGTRTIEILGKGRGFGWSSVLCDPCAVSASAVCQKPTVVIALGGSDLRAMLDAKPELGYRVMDRLAQILGNRLRAVYGAMDTFR